MATIGRRAYAEMYGPTVGDRLRLADTALVIQVEDDFTLRAGGYGEEVKFGGGKTIRDGMGQGQAPNGPHAHEAADLVITQSTASAGPGPLTTWLWPMPSRMVLPPPNLTSSP